MVRYVSTGTPFEAQVRYSRAVIRGDWCFVSGVSGYDYTTLEMPESAADQAKNCFETILSVLNEANFKMRDIVRVTHMIADRNLIDEILPVLGSRLGHIRPAATLMIASLMRPEMLYEVEVTAYKGA